MSTPPHYKETRFGFEYGAAKVERAFSHKGYVGIRITTKRHFLDIDVTPSGFIRVGKPIKSYAP